MAEDWSRTEVEATVADYFAMLDLEPRREPYVKKDHIRGLTRLLMGRTERAIEYEYATGTLSGSRAPFPVSPDPPFSPTLLHGRGWRAYLTKNRVFSG